MQFIRDVKQGQFTQGTVVTIGNFDGLHLGHQQLLTAVRRAASENKWSSVMMTFEPNPKEFFAPEKPIPRLMRFIEKWQALEPFDLDYLCCLRFDKKMAALTAEAFVKQILVEKFNVKLIIVGDEFRFGAKRAGDIALLKSLGRQYGFNVDAQSQSVGQFGKRISSSRVREALAAGDFEAVKHLTGRHYVMTGKVAYGNQIGRKLGFPTANIHLQRKKSPLSGVFVVEVEGLADKPLPGVASLGYRPVFDGKQMMLEVHLFDFDKMIYGKRLTVTFLHKIRDEENYPTVAALIKQIENDVIVAKKYFA